MQCSRYVRCFQLRVWILRLKERILLKVGPMTDPTMSICTNKPAIGPLGPDIIPGEPL